MSYFKKLGDHFGYPDCCSQWFDDRMEGKIDFRLTEAQSKADNGQGFMPCPVCAEKVASGEAKIEDLIENREHPKPYPHQDRQYIKEFINEL